MMLKMSDEAKDEIQSIVLLSNKFSQKPVIGSKRTFDEIENKIVAYGMKILRMNDAHVAHAYLNKILINKEDGLISPSEEFFSKFKEHIENCKKPACSLNIIPDMLKDEKKSSDAMNHLIRCTNPMCSDIICGTVKNVIKFNFIKTNINSYQNQLASRAAS
jgi:hypothetical protein